MKFSDIKAKLAEAEAYVNGRTSRDFLIPKAQRVPSKEMMEQIPGLKTLGPHGEYVFKEHYKAFSFASKAAYTKNQFVQWINSCTLIHKDNPYYDFLKAVEAKKYYNDFLTKAMSSFAVKGIDWDNPKIYIVSCKNTYAIRAALKANGALFNDGFWYFTWPQETYPVIEFDLDEIADFAAGYMVYFNIKYIKDILMKSIPKDGMISTEDWAWFGNKGERTEIEMKVEHTYNANTEFGTVNRLIGVNGKYRFMMNNNMNAFEGATIRVKATVTGHFLTKDGIKTTYLSRPKSI